MAKHPKRPRDPNQLAKLIVGIASGEVREDKPAPLTPAEREALEKGFEALGVSPAMHWPTHE